MDQHDDLARAVLDVLLDGGGERVQRGIRRAAVFLQGDRVILSLPAAGSLLFRPRGGRRKKERGRCRQAAEGEGRR
jgi:hypothetical protein